MQIVSDYEELFKFRTFSDRRNENPFLQEAFECTYERLKNDLKNQYSENLEDKIMRWISVSKALYFQDVLPISFYIQAKMLYRDGFYEAAINVSRSICEMICYEELAKQSHPFGDITIADKHSPGFNTLKQFLLLPKKVEKKIFRKDIVSKIVDGDIKDKDSNFLKCSYELKNDNYYHLKLINAKKEENLNRFIRIFKNVRYNHFETFTTQVLQELEYVWTNGSTYVHVKKSSQDAKTDAFSIIDRIGYVLFSLYKGEPELGTAITSAYSRFQDVCTGVTYSMDAFSTPEAAQSGYYNIPSKEQKERMIKIVGIWDGEWGINEKTTKGVLEFKKEGEYINCYLNLGKSSPIIPMGISFFGDYFLINQLKGDKSRHFFQLSFLNDKTLIGQHRHDFLYVIFRRQN